MTKDEAFVRGMDLKIMTTMIEERLEKKHPIKKMIFYNLLEIVGNRCIVYLYRRIFLTLKMKVTLKKYSIKKMRPVTIEELVTKVCVITETIKAVKNDSLHERGPCDI